MESDERILAGVLAMLMYPMSERGKPSDVGVPALCGHSLLRGADLVYLLRHDPRC